MPERRRDRQGRLHWLTTTDLADEPQLAAQWARVRGRLQNEVGDVEYRTWLRQMTLGGLDGDEITVHLPSRFLRDWVRSHYGDRLNALWQAENRTRPPRRNPRRRPDHADHRPRGTVTPLSAPAGPAAGKAGMCRRRRTPAAMDERGEADARLDPRFTLRQLRRRQAQRIRLCLRAPRRRRAGHPPASTRCSSTAASAWARPT